MNSVPLILGVGLLFWGQQASLLLAAVPMALLLEGSRRIPWRWDIGRKGFHRLSDLCTLAFVGTAIYCYATRPAVVAIMVLAQHMPMVLFPLMLGQALSVQGRVDTSTFFWSWRKRQSESGPRVGVDVSAVYLAVCGLAAGAANLPGAAYYAGVVLLSGWALWRCRPDLGRGRSAGAVAVLAVSVALGWYGHKGLYWLQGWTEIKATDLFFGIARLQKDPFQTSTAIGSIGELKRSGRILLRVRPEPGQPAPSLLRSAGYDLYRGGQWLARDSGFKFLAKAKGEGQWELSRAPDKTFGVEILMEIKEGAGLLVLPDGTVSIDNLPAAEVAFNRLGAARVEYGPPSAAYAVRYSPKVPLDGPPGPSDLGVPDYQKAVLSRLTAELGLGGLPPEQAVRALSRFFQDHFRYSLVLDAGKGGEEPLERFLLKTRSGHCEYFATAGALLLRSAGIPARYATGFAVMEFSRLEKAYIVRQRHSHAWVRVYLDGAWRDADFTPPDWAETEEREKPVWQGLADLGSWLRRRFADWRSSGALGRTLVWPLGLGLLFLAWRFRRMEASRVRKESERAAALPVLPGSDSEFYRVEKLLRERGFEREPHETLAGWLKRLEGLPGRPVDTAPLKRLLALHDRHRFDPQGLGPEERGVLRSGVEEWLGAGNLAALDGRLSGSDGRPLRPGAGRRGPSSSGR